MNWLIPLSIFLYGFVVATWAYRKGLKRGYMRGRKDELEWWSEHDRCVEEAQRMLWRQRIND
jgi:hypothetical protein